MPTNQRHRDEIAAAVAAYDRDHPDAPLPPTTPGGPEGANCRR
jgi:hypothetical protein